MSARKNPSPPKPKPPPPGKRGRKSTFSEAVASEIIESLSEGIPLSMICRKEGMPKSRTVYEWIEEYAEFGADFARARRAGCDALAEQCLQIADDEMKDWEMGKKGPISNETVISRARLQVDTRLKLIAKWHPTRYGDLLRTEVSGPGGKPIALEAIRQRALEVSRALSLAATPQQDQT